MCVCVFCFWFVSPKHSEDKHLLFELFTPELFELFSPEKIQEVKPELFELLNFLIFFHLQFISLLKGKVQKVQKFKKFKKSSWNIFSEEKNQKNKKNPGIFFLGKKLKGKLVKTLQPIPLPFLGFF